MPPRRRRRSKRITEKTLEHADAGLGAAQKRQELWKQRIARSIELRKDWEVRFQVEDTEKYFLGEQAEKKLCLNRFAATIKTSRPNLFFSMPKFYVRSKPGRVAPVAERIAASGEGVLEAIARQDEHLELNGDLAVLQAFFRIGVLKICYDPRMESNPKAGEPIYATEDGEPILDDLKEPVPVRHPLTGDTVREPDDVMTDEVYRWEWVDAANLLLPDEGPNLLRWSWIGEEVIVPLEKAKADTRFPRDLRTRLVTNLSRAKLRAGREPRELPGSGGEELLRYVECYDLREKKWLVQVDGQSFSEFLLDEDLPAWIDNDPYALLFLGEPILGPDPLPWPVPVVRDWIAPQDEYNIRRRQIMEGAKRSARKGWYTDGTFDDPDEAVKLLQSPEDMVFAKVTDKTGIGMLETPNLNPAIYNDIPLLNLDWMMITGQTGARLSNPEGDTATEATFVERAANLRDSDLQKRITRWMAAAGRKMFQCLKETLTLDLWIQLREMNDSEFAQYLERVYGIPRAQQSLMTRALPGLRELFRERFGQQKWMQVTRQDLQFEADVTIAPGSTRPRNLDVERRQWLDFLRVIGQFPQLALSRELLRATAAKFEYIDERMLDELTALAEKMVQVNANQAGRNQGGANGAASGGANAGVLPGLMQLMTGGAGA